MNKEKTNSRYWDWTIKEEHLGGFICECKCGKIQWIAKNKLLKGKSKRCRKCANKLVSQNNIRHGCGVRKGRPRIYTIYYLMKRRCYDKNSAEYELYGKKGIEICSRWLESFENFLSDMGHPPEGYFIDRIDFRGNYEPFNCRWISPADSARNTSRNIFLMLDGEKLCKAEFLRRLNIKSASHWNYFLKKLGSQEKAVQYFKERLCDTNVLHARCNGKMI